MKEIKAGIKLTKLLLVFIVLGIFVANDRAVLAENVDSQVGVEPDLTDLEFSMSASVADGSSLNEADEIIFTIYYRSLLTYAADFLITTDWEQGLVGGSGSNYIDAMDYVVASATDSPEGTVPVIDLQNRQISWDIEDLPPSVNESVVSYSLRVKNDLPAGNKITVSVESRAKMFNTTWPDEELNYIIQGSLQPSPTPTGVSVTLTPTPTGVSATATPVSVVTNTPGPTITSSPTATPSPTKEAFAIKYVKLNEITSNSARVIFETNEESGFSLFYDEKQKNLENKIEGLDYHKIHAVNITELTANKRYYFKIKVEKKSGQAFWSDLFTFVTASEDGVIPIRKEDIVISSGEMVISSEKTDTLVLVKESPISISVSIAEAERILSISAKFRSTKVLGLNSEAKAPVGETRLVEMLPGVFSGRLLTPSKLDQYELILEIKDKHGAFHIKSVPYRIFVSEAVGVFGEKNKRPVEGAKVEILKYQESFGDFISVGERFALPYETNEKGKLDVNLPSGKYLLKISAHGFKTKEYEMDLGRSIISYPEIFLEKSFSLKAFFLSQRDTLKDVSDFNARNFKIFFSSGRAKQLALLGNVAVIAFFVFVNLLLRRKEKMVLALKPMLIFIHNLLGLLVLLSILFFIRYQDFWGSFLFVVSGLIALSIGFVNIKKIKNRPSSQRQGGKFNV
ncbi:fibronectin type III domain-containing protein [Patescibacteria group bacterium]|nr:fibronectin type III domain-containing protein [Patescibacteria group bacterium]MCG2702709.1 fibronectin type III domain-containing protein [Candidatus Parcubacteria bacterium]MBU4265063.1 fibronectin type III domain-containing protein [Patescibacteria group bacterium]MBU4390272.1 fibronectin type III domain-containing protein [Patescibacteria group bacterium]MBU4397148.1 fibronectin type III domain-containing protein [Patescibacteria group bacterium]